MPPPDMPIPAVNSGYKVLSLGALVVAVLLGCFWVLLPFLSAIVWAVILAYTTWPLYRLIRKPFGGFRAWAASAMMIIVASAVLVPLLWIGALAAEQVANGYHALTAFLDQSSHELPRFVRAIPWLGDQAQRQVERFAADPLALKDQIFTWLKAWSGNLTLLAGGVGRNLSKLFITLLTVFFLYRDGDELLGQCRKIGSHFFGARIDPYVATIARMTRAVVYGLVATVFAQGLVAGVGYAVLGIEGAALLGALTGALSLLPVVGTLVVWGSIGADLLISGHVAKGIIMLLWGTLLVHPTDNMLRPLLIGNATRVPFLLVMFGVLGGMSAFGLVGAFVGPVLLAVAVAVWRQWAVPEGIPVLA